MKPFIRIIFTITIVFCSCQKAKNKGKQLVEKSKTEIIDVSKKTWKKSVNFALNSFSSTEDVSLSDIYANENIPEVSEIESTQINVPPNFYSCYFKYKSDPTEMIQFLSSLETKLPDISDAKAKKTNGTEIKDHLEFIENKMPDFKKEISFFYEIATIENVMFYRCNKYPNANYLAIDIDNGIMYHLIKNYWD